jgi:sec-independent protein translocase protein TatC
MPASLKGKTRLRKSSDDPEDFRASLVEHLEELRDRIIRSLIVLAVGWVIGWYLERPAYSTVTTILGDAIKKRMPAGSHFEFVFTNATEPFMLKLKLSFMIGLVLAFPIILLQLWGFVAPGLKPVERRAVRAAAPASVIFFAIGVFFCWIILPGAFTWFTTYMDEFTGTNLLQNAGDLVFMVLKMLLAFGITFQLPLVIFVLGKIGLLSPETLIRNWRQATAAIFFVAMVVTPSNDIPSMLMMAVPLSLLFVGSVYAVKFTTKKKKRSDNDLDDLD